MVLHDLAHVSILVFQWISLEAGEKFTNSKSEDCFNPSFSMDISGSLIISMENAEVIEFQS